MILFLPQTNLRPKAIPMLMKCKASKIPASKKANQIELAHFMLSIFCWGM